MHHIVSLVGVTHSQWTYQWNRRGRRDFSMSKDSSIQSKSNFGQDFPIRRRRLYYETQEAAETLIKAMAEPDQCKCSKPNQQQNLLNLLLVFQCPHEFMPRIYHWSRGNCASGDGWAEPKSRSWPWPWPWTPWPSWPLWPLWPLACTDLPSLPLFTVCPFSHKKHRKNWWKKG